MGDLPDRADADRRQTMLFGGQDYNELGGTLGASQEDRTKTGYAWHAIVDNLSRLVIAGLLCLLCCMPAFAGFLLGLLWNRPEILLVAGAVGGLIAGPAFGTLYDACLMAYMGYPGRWWERYKKVFAREWKGCLVPGLIMGLILATTANVLMNLHEGTKMDSSVVVCMVILLVISCMILSYFWPQRMLLDLTFLQTLKNSWIMVVSHPLLALGSAAIQIGYWALMLILYPYSIVFLLILSAWLPVFLSVRVVYEALNKALELDQRFEKAKEEENA
jgi:uncharacterized membrane protein YesL